MQNKIQAGDSHTISNYIMAQDYQELIAKIGDLLTQSRTQAAASINKAKPGDRYLFEDIKARCPGDAAGRELSDMSFQIK